MSDSINAQELIEILLNHPKVTAHIKSRDITTFLNIMETKRIGKNINIITYQDYLREMPLILLKFQPHISESQYNKLILFKSPIDSLVYDILFKSD